MATRNYEGEKFESNLGKKTLDALTIEEALQININSTPFTVSMRTPGEDICLVRGMFHSEGILKNTTFSPDIVLKKENDEGIVTIVDMVIPEDELGSGYSNSRSLLSVSSCGICGKTELSDLSFIGKTIDSKSQLNISDLEEMFRKMKTQQFDFHKSGGTHAAAAFTLSGELLSSKEDIGRHNAVDKVVGTLILSEKLKEASVLTVSGRISYEIIIKCFKAKIPFLAAVSAPSSLAVDYAKELGITLLAFCRNDKATCYSHPKRIKNDESSCYQNIGNQAG